MEINSGNHIPLVLLILLLREIVLTAKLSATHKAKGKRCFPETLVEYALSADACCV